VQRQSWIILVCLSLVLLTGAAEPMKPPIKSPSEQSDRQPAVDAQFSSGTMVFFGSQPGAETLDRGRSGQGNPFATAFIGALRQRGSPITQFSSELRDGTKYESMGFQVVDQPSALEPPDLVLAPEKVTERRLALVLVVSDYDKSDGLQSLAGAEYDASELHACVTKRPSRR
jgi:hypothetical protein